MTRVSSSRRAALASACSSAAAAFIVWVAALGVPRGRALDAGALQAFTGVARPPLEPSITGMAKLADPTPFAIAAALLVFIALLRRRPMMAAVTAAIRSARTSRPSCSSPRSRTCGSSTCTASSPFTRALGRAGTRRRRCRSRSAACSSSAPWLRPLAALIGAAYAVGVGYALVALGWHLPSDVLGGFLVAATFTLGGAAALAALEARRPEVAVRRPPPTPISLPVLAAARRRSSRSPQWRWSCVRRG